MLTHLWSDIFCHFKNKKDFVFGPKTSPPGIKGEGVGTMRFRWMLLLIGFFAMSSDRIGRYSVEYHLNNIRFMISGYALGGWRGDAGKGILKRYLETGSSGWWRKRVRNGVIYKFSHKLQNYPQRRMKVHFSWNIIWPRETEERCMWFKVDFLRSWRRIKFEMQSFLFHHEWENHEEIRGFLKHLFRFSFCTFLATPARTSFTTIKLYCGLELVAWNPWSLALIRFTPQHSIHRWWNAKEG